MNSRLRNPHGTGYITLRLFLKEKRFDQFPFFF